MHKLIPVVSAIVFLSFTQWSSAMAGSDENKPKTIDCSYDKDYIQGLPTNLVDLQQKAVKVGQDICLSSLKVLPNESIEVSAELTNFAKAARKEFDQLFPDNDNMFKGVSGLSESWYHQVTDIKNDYRNFALIKATRSQLEGMPPRAKDIEFELYADRSSKKNFTLTQAQKDHCEKVIDDSSIPWSGKKDCKNAFDRLWGNAASPFQYLYTNRVLEENGQKIINLQGQWKTFIKESRYQTPLDVWATTVWYSNQFKSHHLSGPPPHTAIPISPSHCL